MNLQLIIAAVIAASSFGAAWKLQDWRMDAKEKEHAEQVLADERRAATRAIRTQEAVITAQNAAADRAAVLRRDADGSRTALVGLSDAAAAALRDAAASQDACLERARALGELFPTVAEAGRRMAEKADLHANDARTLSEAWPINKE